MGTYQGPHAAVRQQFQITPGAVAIEDLPPTVVGTAYDVYSKEKLGSSFGILDNELPWPGSNVVVHDASVIGQRGFDFYPAKVFANSPFGNIDLEDEDDLSSTGYTIDKDKDYDVPGTGAEVGQSQAILPFYKKEGLSGTDRVKVLATDLNTVIIPNGAVVTAQIKPGMKVLIDSATFNPAGIAFLGTVQSVGNDETKINLATPISSDFDDGVAIYIGATPDFSSPSATAIGDQVGGNVKDIPDTLYDPTADFISAKVAVGDTVYISSLSITGSIDSPKLATVVSIIDKNTLRYNTRALLSGRDDFDFTRYNAFVEEPGNTINVYSYSIKRLVGFSENYGLKLLNSETGVPVARTSDTVLTYEDTVGVDTVPALREGDLFALASDWPVGTDDREMGDLYVNRIKTITHVSGSPGTYTITTESPIRVSTTGNPIFSGGEDIAAWTPKIETDVLGDFRAIRSEENKVVKRIGSTEDIFNAWVREDEDAISVYNELAYMAFIAFSRSGGKVCYGSNVDAASNSLAGEYTAALEDLKLYDLYSHCFGTTDGGVNALMVPYVLEQSEPYEGHERIGIVTYDELDVYLMGADTGSMQGYGDANPGLVTIDGAFNPVTGGVTVSDKVRIYDSDGAFVVEATVTETPTEVNQVQTDYGQVDTELAIAAGHTVKFISGRKADQAIRAGNLGLGERRVAITWPGWFYGDVGDDRLLLPPYYIAAAVCGMDAGIIASQSFTNLPFAIPGISNIQLDTNTYFRKAQLDDIGGGGVDIMIQDATITQSIKSRHDLTTNMDAVEFRERSITKQADVAAKTIRNAIAPYVGRYNITPQLFQFLGQVCSVVSTKLVKEGIVSKLAVKSIKRDEVIADKINFFIECTVFVAGNYYDVTLLVKSR